MFDRVSYQRKWIAARREEFFRDKECAECGATWELELDHIDPKTKVSHNIWSWSKERRDEELVKCQVLCAGCHIEKTRREQTNPNHGSTGYRKGCRCTICREAERLRMQRYRSRR